MDNLPILESTCLGIKPEHAFANSDPRAAKTLYEPGVLTPTLKNLCCAFKIS